MPPSQNSYPSAIPDLNPSYLRFEEQREIAKFFG